MSAAAAVAHLACIAIGAPAYRIMGAGERTARAVEAGKVCPTLIILSFSGVLLVWAAYARGGAGVIQPLPFTGLVLPAICMVYLGRAVSFPLLRLSFPENSRKFWLLRRLPRPGVGVPLRHPVRMARPVRPNPSLKRSANGRPPGPVWRYAVHFRQPGPGVLPQAPA